MGTRKLARLRIPELDAPSFTGTHRIPQTVLSDPVHCHSWLRCLVYRLCSATAMEIPVDGLYMPPNAL